MAAEHKQLENYEHQGMLGAPCITPQDASVFHWVWIYSVTEHENNRKKVRGVCDGSTKEAKSLYLEPHAPIPQHLDFQVQIALSALLGLWLWQTDVAYAFVEAEGHLQKY